MMMMIKSAIKAQIVDVVVGELFLSIEIFVFVAIRSRLLGCIKELKNKNLLHSIEGELSVVVDVDLMWNFATFIYKDRRVVVHHR